MKDKLIIDDYFLQQIIEQCYVLDKRLKVIDRKGNEAILKSGTCTLKKNQEIENTQYNLLETKRVFIGLILKHKNFEYEGYTYSGTYGKWDKAPTEMFS